jgi:hypothetical protein
MLDRLTLADFAPLVGTAFPLVGAGDPPIAFTLAAANDLSGRGSSVPGTRPPFSLHFRGPADPLLPQRTRLLDAGPLGRLEIFLVPIGRDAAGATYEAIFN